MNFLNSVISLALTGLISVTTSSCVWKTNPEVAAIRLKDIDSSFERLDDKLYARCVYHDSTQLGEVYIYTLTAEDKLLEIQHIDSLPAHSILFGVGVYADYNSDGLNDLLIVYGSGARGGNTLNYLFTQKKLNANNVVFEYVRGSWYPPNLRFDTSKGMIESTMLHGGVTFVDYKIIGDSLVEQGGTEVTGDDKWVIRIHYKIDSSGQEVELGRDSVYDNYENFYTR